MKFFRPAGALACAVFVFSARIAFGQAPNDAVRVTVSMHPDGSRTIYNFDNDLHRAVATTTDADGKVRQTIRYELDNAGRFSSGEISGPDGRISLKSQVRRRRPHSGRSSKCSRWNAVAQDRLHLRFIRETNRLFRLRCLRQIS